MTGRCPAVLQHHPPPVGRWRGGPATVQRHRRRAGQPLSRGFAVSGCGAAWLARLTGGQEVGSSNLPSPTTKVKVPPRRRLVCHRGAVACCQTRRTRGRTDALPSSSGTAREASTLYAMSSAAQCNRTPSRRSVKGTGRLRPLRTATSETARPGSTQLTSRATNHPFCEGMMLALLGTAAPPVLRDWFCRLAEGGRVVDDLQERRWGASDSQVIDRDGLHWLIGSSTATRAEKPRGADGALAVRLDGFTASVVGTRETPFSRRPAAEAGQSESDDNSAVRPGAGGPAGPGGRRG
jgi:hypothetical protein